MSRFSGPQRRGAMRLYRENKRKEAIARSKKKTKKTIDSQSSDVVKSGGTDEE